MQALDRLILNKLEAMEAFGEGYEDEFDDLLEKAIDEFIPLTAAGTVGAVAGIVSAGTGVLQLLHTIGTSGDLSWSAPVVNYIHDRTPAGAKFTQASMFFVIMAYHPSLSSWQKFFFAVVYDYNGYDLRGITIRCLEAMSSRMYASRFSISFNPIQYSLPKDPVAAVEYKIHGVWDPIGYGLDDFRGNLLIKADGSKPTISINSTNSFVRLGGTQFKPGTLVKTKVRREKTDWKHSAIRNRYHAWENLGWGQYASRIAQLLGVPGARLDSRQFAEAMFRWQAKNNLSSDGILGPNTWKKIRRLLTV